MGNRPPHAITNPPAPHRTDLEVLIQRRLNLLPGCAAEAHVQYKLVGRWEGAQESAKECASLLRPLLPDVKLCFMDVEAECMPPTRANSASRAQRLAIQVAPNV